MNQSFPEIPITDKNGNTIGYAPAAPKPDWIRRKGPGQANVKPNCWSLTIDQWIRLVRSCVSTPTWTSLAAARGGEYKVTMYDVRDHFIVPWTKGTGSSIALLMNEDKEEEDGEVELMISHAWGGSVIETYNCLQNLVNHHKIPNKTKIFFCTFSMYQAEDEEETSDLGGLNIGKQLDLHPFSEIIKSRPKYGMFVVHTTEFELYSRLWTVHEVDECTEVNLKIRGLFDIYRWSTDKFSTSIEINTEYAQCLPEDMEMLKRNIEKNGGFEQLNRKIKDFRKKMFKELVRLLKLKGPPTSIQSANVDFEDEGDSAHIQLAALGACCCTGGLFYLLMCAEAGMRKVLCKHSLEDSCFFKNLFQMVFLWDYCGGDAWSTYKKPEIHRKQVTFDWIKEDKVTEVTFEEYLTRNSVTRQHEEFMSSRRRRKNKGQLFFRMPLVSRSVLWIYEKNWTDSETRKVHLPLGKDSYPFGQPKSKRSKKNIDKCFEGTCCLIGSPFHCMAILFPPLCCLTPILRWCPPNGFYSCLLAADGDCNGVCTKEKKDEFQYLPPSPVQENMHRSH